MLQKPTAIYVLMSILVVADFSTDANRALAEAMYELANKGKPIDPITIGHWPVEWPRCRHVGGSHVRPSGLTGAH